MHVPSLSVDLHWLIQLIFTALVIVLGVGYILLKNTASKYFVVDANSDSIDSSSSSSPYSSSCETSSGISVMPGVPVDGCCAVCGNRSTKHCSRCKAVNSESCQSIHWKKEHKSKCKASGRRTVAFGGFCSVQKQVDKILFPYDEFVKLFNWDKPGPRPCGLINCGNSCFANVVLQCLAHTRPLVAYLMEKGHRRRNEWCFLCELQSHLERVTYQQPFSPLNILSHLPSIGGNLGCGKQEDAHEFMRYAIDTMQSICLEENGGEKRIHPKFQETTLIQHIFGGQLQSQVICTQCNQVSNQYENMMDLTVEIQGDAASLEECLDQFTVKEYLHGDNMYRCDGCNDYVKAWKRLTIRQSPNILTIALKRFQSGRFGKLNKKISFPETLNLSPYMSEEGDHTDEYKLFGVVVHVDMLNASFFGHYICCIKDFQGTWYIIDDCKVMTVELDDVLSQRAYMLLYRRVSPRATCLKTFEAPKKQEKLDNSSMEVQQCCPEKQICNVSVAEDPTSSRVVQDQKDDIHTEMSSVISSVSRAHTITSELSTNEFHVEENSCSSSSTSEDPIATDNSVAPCEMQQVGSSIQPLEAGQNSVDIRSENIVPTSSLSQPSVVEEDEQSSAAEMNGSCKVIKEKVASQVSEIERSQNEVEVDEMISEMEDPLEQIAVTVEAAEVDKPRLLELNDLSEKCGSQFAYLVKNWEDMQANVVRLLKEELDILSKQRLEAELKKLEILEEHRFEEEGYFGDKRHVSILDDLYDTHQALIPHKIYDTPAQSNGVEIEVEYDTVSYWKQKALHLEMELQASRQREQILIEKIKRSVQNMEKQSAPVEELSQMLERADNFIHFILQNAPIVLGHMDKELRYRFVYNHYPCFKEEDLIGKTETEIFSGVGVKESLDFKREVLERGLPGKREITFETELIGSKTFLIYVEPVFSKAGDTIGVNYIGMDITDQVRKREKMAKLREEIAVQRAMETELNKTLHITEETMRAKQMLATMSHEIRSPLSGVISMAEILATTNLNSEQRHLISLMISSGDVVIQLINDILDLSKVESGVMKLEAIKFRPREVVKHVLQTTAASLRKMLTLEGHVAEEVPLEVVGDVLRIRQILTNLVSNAIKFTHEGKVGIKLDVVPEPNLEDLNQNSSEPSNSFEERDLHRENIYSTYPSQSPSDSIEIRSPVKEDDFMDRDEEKHSHLHGRVVWIRCDVYDTGIGIPENALATLFKQYTQVSADHARKYGGTGLGLSICKQLVELMGGYLTVTSTENSGSTFTFVLPYRVSPICEEQSDDSDELPNQDSEVDKATAVQFKLQPQTLGSLFSASENIRGQILPDLMTAPDALPCSSIETPLLQMVSVPSRQSSKGEDKFCNELNQCSDHGNGVVQKFSFGGVASLSEQRIKTQEEECQMQMSERSPLSMAAGIQEEIQSPEKPRILLVEDNKINVMVTQTMMKQLGYIIDVVNNGVEAVRAVQSHCYDLILMDVCMPVMDGLQATRIIREYEMTGSWDAAVEAEVDLPIPFLDSPFSSQRSYESDKRTTIIAMTANALIESAEECYANGMDSFVTKPVTFQKLRQCLKEYLS
ncbi:hypothetical protein V2J09_019817 [Rumex salicifolius]